MKQCRTSLEHFTAVGQYTKESH